MTRESTIEQDTCSAFQANGVPSIKVGREGYPDRLFLLGGNRHLWVEFKQPRGRARATQRERVKELRALGDRVVFVDRAPSAMNVTSYLQVLRQGGGCRLEGERTREV